MTLKRIGVLCMTLSAARGADCSTPMARNTIASLATSITAVEGGRVPGTLCFRLHNPGCLNGLKGYLKFKDDDAGWSALTGWIIDHSRLKLRAMLTLYNGPAYADVVLKRVLLAPDTLVCQ